MQLTFLEGTGTLRRLAKQFSLVNGKLEKTSYRNAKRMTSFTEEVITLDDFADALRHHALEGRALFTSNLKRPLKTEPRAGMDDGKTATPWLCLDFDDAPFASVEDFITEVPALEGISYIVAYSASQGFSKRGGLNAHLFFMLEQPTAFKELRELISGINWYSEVLRSSITLSDSGLSLRTTLDPAGARRSSLIYLAPPLLGEGLDDPYPSIYDRIKVVHKQEDTLSLSSFPSQWRDPSWFAAELENYMDELRELFGLDPIDYTTKTANIDGFNVEYLALPPHSVISLVGGALSDNGIVRCNVNKGDSAAYYFHFGLIQDDTLMFNFKSEPPFLIAQADEGFTDKWNAWYIGERRKSITVPDWMQEFQVSSLEATPVDEEPATAPTSAPTEAPTVVDAIIAAANEDKPSEKIKPGRIHPDGHFIFRDRLQDEHFEYRRRRDGSISLSPLKLTSAKTQAKVLGIPFNKEKGFPTISVVYDVSEARGIYEENGETYLNTYTRPAAIEYLPSDKRTLSLEQALEAVERDTPAYYQSLVQAMGGDTKAVAHFLNWLSVLLTIPSARVNTAWLLRGVHGSGKSSLVDTMIYALVNHGREVPDNSVSVVDKSLSISSFDDWRFGKKLVLIDEVEVASDDRTQGGQLVYNWYKSLVTTERATLNKKGSRLENLKLNTGYLFASNYRDRFYLDPSERRYHVPPFQEKLFREGVPLAFSVPTWADFRTEIVAKEAPRFGAILSHLRADERLAQTLYDCGDFADIAEASRTPFERFAAMLRDGDMDQMFEAIAGNVEVDVSRIDKAEVSGALRYIAYLAATSGGFTDYLPVSVMVQLYMSSTYAKSTISSAQLGKNLVQQGITKLATNTKLLDKGLIEALSISNQGRHFVVKWKPTTDWSSILEHRIIRRFLTDMGVKRDALNNAVAVSASVH